MKATEWITWSPQEVRTEGDTSVYIVPAIDAHCMVEVMHRHGGRTKSIARHVPWFNIGASSVVAYRIVWEY